MTTTAKSSGLIAATAGTAIKAAPSRVNTLTVISDGTNTATATLYDNTSAASGTVLAKATAVAAGASTVCLCFDNPIRAENGLYIVVTGTGSGAIVTFDA